MKPLIAKIKSHLQTKEQKIVAAIIAVIAFLVISGIMMVIGANSGGTSSENLTATPSPTISETPTPTEEPTPEPTDEPTTAPTKAPTSTPAPTSAPTSTPTPTPTSGPEDKEAPSSNITSPEQNGQIISKTGDQVCAQINPTDNLSGQSDIATSYHFDSDGWSDYQTNKKTLCKDTLSNGSHTISVRSKDKAGNIEAEQQRTFTVAIPGN